MKQPVLFFAFANKAEQPLPDLLEEGRLIDEALSDEQAEGKLVLHLDKHTSGNDIFRKLLDFRNRISIFHFGGHASSSHLYLTDQSANEKGLAQLLHQQKHLRLVFLNGCNTSGFIQQLLDKGIPAVIATTREVGDKAALRLASLFYQSLSRGASIGESFDFAKGALQTDSTITREISRGLKLPKTGSVDFPWGLYYNNSSALDWNLEEASADVNPVPKKFWLRFSLILLPAIIFYLWSLLHFGFEDLTILLTILGALSAIVFFLVKFYGRKFPGIRHTFSNLQSFSLKPGVIGLFYLPVLGVMLIISSVRINHPGDTPIAAKLKTKEGLPVTHFNLHPGNPNRTTLLALVNPLKREHNLEIDGYLSTPVHYGWFGGAKISNLLPNPSVLVRLPHYRFIQKSRLRLKVSLNGEPYYYISNNPGYSILLGNQKIAIEENIYTEWNENLASEDPLIREQAIRFWLDPVRNDSLKPIEPGDTLRIELLTTKDSLLKTRQLIVSKNNMTDVLLH